MWCIRGVLRRVPLLSTRGSPRTTIRKLSMSPSQPSRTGTEPGYETGRANFTQTRWSKLLEARIAASSERCTILDFLIRRS